MHAFAASRAVGMGDLVVLGQDRCLYTAFVSNGRVPPPVASYDGVNWVSIKDSTLWVLPFISPPPYAEEGS